MPSGETNPLLLSQARTEARQTTEVGALQGDNARWRHSRTEEHLSDFLSYPVGVLEALGLPSTEVASQRPVMGAQ